MQLIGDENKVIALKYLKKKEAFATTISNHDVSEATQTFRGVLFFF